MQDAALWSKAAVQCIGFTVIDFFTEDKPVTLERMTFIQFQDCFRLCKNEPNNFREQLSTGKLLMEIKEKSMLNCLSHSERELCNWLLSSCMILQVLLHRGFL